MVADGGQQVLLVDGKLICEVAINSSECVDVLDICGQQRLRKLALDVGHTWEIHRHAQASTATA